MFSIHLIATGHRLGSLGWQTIYFLSLLQVSKIYSTDLGLPYDYASIMHYGATAFGKENKRTIVPKQKDAEIGQRRELSDVSRGGHKGK